MFLTTVTYFSVGSYAPDRCSVHCGCCLRACVEYWIGRWERRGRTCGVCALNNRRLRQISAGALVFDNYQRERAYHVHGLPELHDDCVGLRQGPSLRLRDNFNGNVRLIFFSHIAAVRLSSRR